MRLARFCVLLTAILITGCGYAFRGGGSVLPPDVRRIYIPFVEDVTAEAGLSTLVTEALRDHFGRFGAVTIVDAPRDADAILLARILRVRRDTRTTTSNTDIALQFDATLTLSGELRRTSGQLLWKNPNISVSRPVGTSADVVTRGTSEFAQGSLTGSDLAALDTREIARGQESQIFQTLAEQAARQIYDEAVAPEF